MRPLPSAYRRKLIWALMNSPQSKDLKKLILSSPQMSRAFGAYLSDLYVQYEDGLIILWKEEKRRSMLVCVGYDNFAFIAAFVRKLWAAWIYAPRGEETLFYEKVCAVNDLDELNLSRMPNSYMVSETVQNLLSIPRILIINIEAFHLVDELIPNFGIIIFKSGCTDDFHFAELEFFEANLGYKSTNALIANFCDFEFAVDSWIDMVKLFAVDDLPPTRRFYFQMGDYDASKASNDFHYLAGCLAELSPAIQENNFLVKLLFLCNASQFPTVSDFLAATKQEYDSIVATLREVPNRLNVLIAFITGTQEFTDIDDQNLSVHFPADDFTITKTDMTWEIESSLMSLTENVNLRAQWVAFLF